VFGLGEAVHPFADHSQRVDVQTGVGLVENRDLRLEQTELQDLVALLLTAGEPLVDAALTELRVRRSFGASPRTAVAAVRRKFDIDTPGISTGYCMARNSPALARSSTVISSTFSPSRVMEPDVTVYLGCPAMA
jgi:hypothetical protein